MIETITITHHLQKPEYHWEIVIPDGPTVLLSQARIEDALNLLGVVDADPKRKQILDMADGRSQAINAELTGAHRRDLASLGKNKKDVGERARQSTTL